MRVGFVVYGDVETTSGGFLYDRKLIEGLRARGDTVDVIELPWPSYCRGLLDGVVRRFGGLGDEFTSDTEPDDRAVDPGEGFDVLVQDELAHPTLVALNARLRRAYGCPIVSVVHHLRCSEARPWWKKRGYRPVERCYLRGVDAAICNSSVTEKNVTALADLPTTIAPPAGDRFDRAIDADAIEERARDGPLVVCFLGSVTARKGLDTLVRGLSRLPDDRWQLTVVGDLGADPTYARRVRRTISRLGVGDRVSLLGGLSDDALADVLRRSHLLVIPSTHEGFGIAYLEGMGFGLPALATTAGGARDVVTHGETGYLCSPGTVGEIARYVRRLADDRALLAEMGVAARACYERWPTWAESAARVGTFLDRIVAGDVSARATGDRDHGHDPDHGGDGDGGGADPTRGVEEAYRAGVYDALA